MKTIILVILVFGSSACGTVPQSPPASAAATPAPSALVDTILACQFNVTFDNSVSFQQINYSLTTYADGHMTTECSTDDTSVVLDLTCLATNPYNFSYDYAGNAPQSGFGSGQQIWALDSGSTMHMTVSDTMAGCNLATYPLIDIGPS